MPTRSLRRQPYKYCCGMQTPSSKAHERMAASDIGGSPRRRSLFQSRSVLPIFSIDISEFSGFSPIVWPTVSNCCWFTRLLVDRLVSFNSERLAAVFEERLTKIIREIIEQRRGELRAAFDAIRRQYPDYVAALEVRFLRQSALRQEMGRYQALFEEGLIPQELYDDLRRGVAGTRASEPRPRFEIGLDTRRLIERLDLLSGLEEQQLERVAKPAAAVHRAERAHHSHGRPRGRCCSFCVRGGRGEAGGPARAARQRRVLWRNGPSVGEAAAGRCSRPDLLPTAAAQKLILSAF